MVYTFDNLKVGLSALQSKYPFMEFGSIGKSVMGNELYSMRLGIGERKVIYVGVHHSLEWLTGVMLMCFADSYGNAYSTKTALFGYDIQELFNTSSIYIIPMLNPDGADFIKNQSENPSSIYCYFTTCQK